MKDFKEKGQMFASVGVTELIVGIGIAILLMIVMSILAAKAFQVSESDIASITDANVKGSVEQAIVSSFEAMELIGDYLPLLVLAILAGAIIVIILGALGGFARGGMGGGPL